MRYYKIDITDEKTGKAVLPSSLGGLALSSVNKDGSHNPSALNIELDIPIANLADPAGGAYLRIWGLGLKDLSSAFDLNDKNISIYGGMTKGLPLANPAQRGLLMMGQIWQSYGNWIGTDQTLDLNFLPTRIGTTQSQINFAFQWPAGQPLSVLIAQVLTQAMPNVKQSINISADLKLSRDQPGVYQTLQQFAQFVQGISKSIIGGTYPGVQIASDGQTVTVSDGTVKAEDKSIKEIAFSDLLGQPTWISPVEIQFKTVLRGDLALFQTIKLPEGAIKAALSTAQSNERFRDKTTFTGKFQIYQLHHFGNFRQPDAMSWNTTVVAIPVK